MRGQARITIDAPPDAVYAIESDVTRVGEWSPECTAAEWIDGATAPVVGARFKGHDKMGPLKWSTTQTVTAAERGREFAFENKQTIWRYRLEPAGAGTDVTESFETRSYGPFSRLVAPERKRQPQLERNIEQSLARLKELAESTG
jgi:hypothetical protein